MFSAAQQTTTPDDQTRNKELPLHTQAQPPALRADLQNPILYA